MAKTLFEKMAILSDSAKYDVSCSSSGSDQKGASLGKSHASGICHSFSADGRCISLLKVLMTNACIYECAYCINRASNAIPRATFSPRELANLTIDFYKRNYIEGLFLSSGILKSENHTMELLLQTLEILRFEYGFGGYIHVKLIPGCNTELIEKVVALASRVSSNIELPSNRSLALLAPNKTKEKVMQPLRAARDISLQKTSAPIPMSTQLIVGATPESDFDILRLSSALYEKALLKRVYYSAYIPINDNVLLPSTLTAPPLLREHRLYQADWLLRFYGFRAEELLDEATPKLDVDLDPKTFWALRHLEHFPVEINTAPKEVLVRIPGIGVRGALKILQARKFRALDHAMLSRLGVSLKRANYFITCKGAYQKEVPLREDHLRRALLGPKKRLQPSLFDWYQGVVGGEV